jgi:hypothetical protein
MANGILLESGLNWIIDTVAAEITSLGGLYVGLVSNSISASVDGQLPLASGIQEINELADCSGYSRKLCSSWTKYGTTSPYLIGDQVTFFASGTWDSVNGYMLCKTISGTDALYVELFPSDHNGTFPTGSNINIIPIYRQS